MEEGIDSMDRSGYLDYTDRENAIDNLEMMATFLTSVDTTWKWKWVILSFHQALYSFGLCVLGGTSSYHNVSNRGTILEDGSVKRTRTQKKNESHALWIERKTLEEIATELNESVEIVTEWIDAYVPRVPDIGEVLCRLQYNVRPGCKPLKLTPSQRIAIERLSYHRNQLVHPWPNLNWGISVSFVASFLLQIMPVIRFIALDIEHKSWRPDMEDRINSAFATIESQFMTETYQDGQNRD